MSKKLIALALAGLFVFSVVAPAATEAVTVDELQAQITALLAQITTLQQQLAQAQGQTSSGVCFYTDLQQGMTSAEVSKLQTQLKLDPTVYPEGLVTGYFGPLTLKAAKAFQAKYGIITTGYVGPLTRAKLNELYCTATVPSGLPEGCTSTSGFSPVTGAPCSGATTTTTTTIVAATEGTLTVTQNPLPGSGTVTLYGGNVNKEIAAYKMKATNSDIRVKRVILQFGISTPSDFPWRDISTISIWDGSTLLKEVPALAANFNEVAFGTTYTIQLDGLDVLVAKDTEKVLSLKATAVSVPQYAKAMTVLIPANGVRGIDSLGLNVYGPPTPLPAHSFTTATAQGPIITTTAAIDSPVAGNFNARSNDITRVDLMKINVKVESVDMTFKGGTIDVVTNDNTTLSAVELYDGSTLLASAATTTTGVVTLSSFTLPVSADTTKVLTVKGVIKANPTAGSRVSVSLPNATGLTGIDANGTAQGNTGAITGNILKAYTASPTFALANASSVRSDSSTSTVNDVGDFIIGISITANSGDIYIPTIDHASYTAGSATAGILQSVATTTSGAIEADKGALWECDANAVKDDSKKVWRIPSGSTSVCTFSYHTRNTAQPSWYTVSIASIKWAASAADLNGVNEIDQTTGLSALKAPALWLQK